MIPYFANSIGYFILFFLGVGILSILIGLAAGVSSSYYLAGKIGIILSCINLMGLIAVALHAFVFYERPPVIPDY